METQGLNGMYGDERRGPQPSSSADRLFRLLDHLVVDLHTDWWLTEVTAIQVVGSEAWVQIARADDPSNSVVLHLSAEATSNHALEALVAWSQIPVDERPRVLDVTQSA